MIIIYLYTLSRLRSDYRLTVSQIRPVQLIELNKVSLYQQADNRINKDLSLPVFD